MSDPYLERAERRAVAAATFAVALLVAEQVAARAVRDALFLSAYGARKLPFMMMASAFVAVAGAELLSRALAWRSPSRVVPATALLSGVLLALLWPVAVLAPEAAAILAYLHVAAFGGALISGFWSLVNERFDPYTARRVMGRIGTGATAGGVAGGLAGWLASQLLPLPATLLALSALHAAAAAMLSRTDAPQAPAENPPATSVSALATLTRIPYLRQLATVVVLGAVVEAVLDWSFKAQVQASYGSGGGRALLSPLSLFYSGMSVVSLLLQATVARPALQHAGIAQTLALRPLLTGVGSLLGVAWPRIATATIARGAHEALTNSLYRSAYELLYTPVPEAEKRRIKAVVDMALDKAGALLGSGLILLILALSPLGGERVLFALAAALSLATLVLSTRLQAGYVRALEQSLLQGSVRLDADQAVDRATQLTLAHTSLIERGTLLRQIEELRGALPYAEASGQVPPAAIAAATASRTAPRDAILLAVADLRSGNADVVRRVLAEHPEPAPLLVAALVPLLARNESFPDVLAVLRRVCGRVAGQLVDAMLDEAGDPLVRRRIARVLKGCASPSAVAGLCAALDDPSFELRQAAAAALAASQERGIAVPLERERVLAHVRRELDSGLPVDRQLPHVVVLLSLTVERQPLQIAWAAMRGQDRVLRGTALEYLANVLPDDVFPRVRSLFGASSVLYAARQRRSTEQVAQELRQSTAALRLEEPPWREPDVDQSAGS